MALEFPLEVGQNILTFKSILFDFYGLTLQSTFTSLSQHSWLLFPNSIIGFKFIQAGLKEANLMGSLKKAAAR